MSEEAIGSVGEHSSLNDEPGVFLTDLVQTDVDQVSQTNNNVHGQKGSVEEWFWVNNEESSIPGSGTPPDWFNGKTFNQ